MCKNVVSRVQQNNSNPIDMKGFDYNLTCTSVSSQIMLIGSECFKSTKMIFGRIKLFTYQNIRMILFNFFE